MNFKRVLAISLVFFLLIGSMPSQIFSYADNNGVVAAENVKEATIVEAAKLSSLEKLASEGKIDANDYIVANEMREQAKRYLANNQSLGTEIKLATDKDVLDEDLLHDEASSQKIITILKDAHNLNDLVASADDFQAMAILANKAKKLANDTTVTSQVRENAEEIAFYIEDVIYEKNFRVNPNYNSRILGVWDKDGKIILRWQHDNKWIPKYGYNLYRVVGDKATLLQEKIGSPTFIEDNISDYAINYAAENFTVDPSNKKITTQAQLADAEKVGLVQLLNESILTEEKAKKIGYSSIVEYENHLDEVTKINNKLPRVMGATHFRQTFNKILLEKSTIKQGGDYKGIVLENGSLVKQNLAVNEKLKSIFNRNDGGVKDLQNVPEHLTSTETNKIKKENLQAIKAVDLDNKLKLNTNAKEIDDKRFENQKLVNARNISMAGCNVDLDFAKTFGLAYEDKLDAKDELNNNYVLYVLLPMHEGVSQYDLSNLAKEVKDFAEYKKIIIDEDAIKYAEKHRPPVINNDLIVAAVEVGNSVEVKAPTKIEGYGMNNAAYLRWDISDELSQKRIVSGYNVYRRLNDEMTFKKINKAPVVIPYQTLKTSKFVADFESSVFYTDTTVKNRDKAEYKVEALDIFGRTSGMSSASLLIKSVIKTKLPMTPIVENAFKTDDVLSMDENKQEWLKAAFADKKNKIVVPISLSQNATDTKLFRIYRSEAYGHAAYSKPVKLAEFEAINKYTTFNRYVDPKGVKIPDSKIKEYMQTMVTPDYNPENIPFSNDSSRLKSTEGDESQKNNPRSATLDLNTDKKPLNSISLLEYKIKNNEVIAQFNPGVYYQDVNIKPGYNYKYWVSAVDSFDNESAWATPVSSFCEKKEYNEKVSNVAAEVVLNPTVNAAERLAGDLFSPYTKLSGSYNFKKLLSDEVQFVGADNSLLKNSNANDAKKENYIAQIADSQIQQIAKPPQIVVAGEAINPKKYLISKDNFKLDNSQIKVVNAYSTGSIYGQSMTVSSLFENNPLQKIISAEYLNFPDVNQIMHMIEYKKGDFNPDGTLDLMWYPYQGENLKEYAIYRAVVNKTIDDLNSMSKSQLMSAFDNCRLIGNTTDNVIKDTSPPQYINDSTHLVYLVAAIPKDAKRLVGYAKYGQIEDDNAVGGWVKLTWQEPKDKEQVKGYNIYRAEVPNANIDNFDSININDQTELEWELLATGHEYTTYYHPVEQVYAHYYAYKIQPVSEWQVEGIPSYKKIRVPSIVPPPIPEMQVPYSKKGKIDVRFKTVDSAKKYILYRSEIVINKEAIEALLSLFASNSASNDNKTNQPVKLDLLQNSNTKLAIESAVQASNVLINHPYATTVEASDAKQALPQTVEMTPAISLKNMLQDDAYDNFKTIKDGNELAQTLSAIDIKSKKDLIKAIIDESGPLVIAKYNSLPRELKSLIKWTKIAEIVPEKDVIVGDTLIYTDENVEFAHKYLYAVASANDDLESTKSATIEGECYKAKPFDPVANINVMTTWQNNRWGNDITWDHVIVKNVSQEDVIKNYLVGYIVYRSANENGTYYQVSGMSKDNHFRDESANSDQTYYYKVVSVDIAGLISDAIATSERTILPRAFSHLDRVKLGRLMMNEYNLGSKFDIKLEQKHKNDGIMPSPEGGIKNHIPKSDTAKSDSASALKREFSKIADRQTVLLSDSSLNRANLGHAMMNTYQLDSKFDMQQARNNASDRASALKSEFSKLVDRQLELLVDERELSVGQARMNDYISKYKYEDNAWDSSTILVRDEIIAKKQYKINNYLIEDIDPYDLRCVKTAAADSDEACDESVIYGRGIVRVGETKIPIPVNFTLKYYDRGTSQGYELIAHEQVDLAVLPYVEENTNTLFTFLHGEKQTLRKHSLSQIDPISGQAIPMIDYDYKINSTVSGYIRNKNTDRVSSGEPLANDQSKLLPELDDFYFQDEAFDPVKGIIRVDNDPIIRWQNFVFYNTDYAELYLDAMNHHVPTPSVNRAMPLVLFNGKAKTSFGHATIDGDGLEYSFDKLSIMFDANYNSQNRTNQAKNIGLYLYNLAKQKPLMKTAAIKAFVNDLKADPSLSLPESTNMTIPKPTDVSDINSNLTLTEKDLAEYQAYIPKSNVNLAGVYGEIKIDEKKLMNLVVPKGITVSVDKAESYFYGKDLINACNTFKGEVKLPFLVAPDALLNAKLSENAYDKDNYQDDNDLVKEAIISLYVEHLNNTDKTENMDQYVLNGIIIDVMDRLEKYDYLVIGGQKYERSAIPFSLQGKDIEKEFILSDRQLQPTMIGNYDLNGFIYIPNAGDKKNEINFNSNGQLSVHLENDIDVSDIKNQEEFAFKQEKVEKVASAANTVRSAVFQKCVEDSFILQTEHVSVDLTKFANPQSLQISDKISVVESSSNQGISVREFSEDNIAWKGILIHSGTVSMPGTLFKLREGSLNKNSNPLISFNLTENEMIYDTNGFMYQNQVDYPADKPLQIALGDNSGDFKYAELKGLNIIMYNNKVDFSTNGKVYIPALNGAPIDFRLYTDDKGVYQIVLLPKTLNLSKLSDVNGKLVQKIAIDIEGGYLDRDGAHIDGVLKINFPNELEEELGFRDLVLPSDQTRMSKRREQLVEGEELRYGMGTFIKPYNISFNGFKVQLAYFDLYSMLDAPTYQAYIANMNYDQSAMNASKKNQSTLKDTAILSQPDFDKHPQILTGAINIYQKDIVMYGTATLADNMEKDTSAKNAKLYISNAFNKPTVNYEKCRVMATVRDGERTLEGETKANAKSTDNSGSSDSKDSLIYKRLLALQAETNTALDLANDPNPEVVLAKVSADYRNDLNSAIRKVNQYDENLHTKISDIINECFVNIKIEQLDSEAALANQQKKLNALRDYLKNQNEEIDQLNKKREQYEKYVKSKIFEGDFENNFGEGSIFRKSFNTIAQVDDKTIMTELDVYIDDFNQLVKKNKGNEAKLQTELKLQVDKFRADFLPKFSAEFMINNPEVVEVKIKKSWIIPVAKSEVEALNKTKKSVDKMVKLYANVEKTNNQVQDKPVSDPANTISENGIIEFRPADGKFQMSLLKSANFLAGTDIQIEGRFGYKAKDTGVGIPDDFYFYAFSIGYLTSPKDIKGIPLGAVEIHNLVAAVGYNMVLPSKIINSHASISGSALMESINTLEIDYDNSQKTFFIIAADVYVMSSREIHTALIKDVCLAFESDGSFLIKGSLYGPRNIAQFAIPSPNNSVKMYGAARVSYSARNKAFKLSVTVQGIPVFAGLTAGGSLGMDWSDRNWMLYLGYPESIMLDASDLGINLQAGFGIKVGTNEVTGDPAFRAKVALDWDDSFTVLIVYADITVHFIAEIGYDIWNNDKIEFDKYHNGKTFQGFAAYGDFYGRLAGGIKVFGFKHDIIEAVLSCYAQILNPREDLEFYIDEADKYSALRVRKSGEPDVNDYHVYAGIYIKYSLDLFLTSLSASFEYDYEKTF